MLTRREAYQLAMLTFKYVPSVSNVVVLMPPLVKNTKARAIFIRRDMVQRGLAAPELSLPGKATKINLVSQREAEVIAKTTDPFVYSWILATVDSQPTLVINPISLDVKKSIPVVGARRRRGPARLQLVGVRLVGERVRERHAARAGAASARRGRARGTRDRHRPGARGVSRRSPGASPSRRSA